MKKVKLNEQIALIKLSKSENPSEVQKARRAFDDLMNQENKKFLGKITGYVRAYCRKRRIRNDDEVGNLLGEALEKIYFMIVKFQSDENISDMNELELALSKWMRRVALNRIQESLRPIKRSISFGKDIYELVDMDGRVTKKSTIENYPDKSIDPVISEKEIEKFHEVVFRVIDSELNVKESEILKATLFYKRREFPKVQLEYLMNKFGIGSEGYFWKLRNGAKDVVEEFMRKNWQRILDSLS